MRDELKQKESMVQFLVKENNDLRVQVYGDGVKRKVTSPPSGKRKKGSAKRRRNEVETIISKQTNDPKSDIKDILSEKMNRRRLETLSKS